VISSTGPVGAVIVVVSFPLAVALSAVTATVFVKTWPLVAPGPTVPEMLTTDWPPAAMLPRFQTLFPMLAGGFALLNTKSPGYVSVSTTLIAVLAPVFWTVTV
jgi:hypothetical protein